MKMLTKALRVLAQLKKLYVIQFFAFDKFNETAPIYDTGCHKINKK